MSDTDVRELVLACSRDSENSQWEELVERFEPCLIAGVRRAFRWAGSFPRDEQLEDLLQETYCKLLEAEARVLRRCTSDSEVAIGVYLGRVAERVALDHLRTRSAEKRGGGRVESLETTSTARGAPMEPATPPVAEDRLISAERRKAFLDSCRRLAGRQRQRNLRIFRLAFLDGLTSVEISERLGRPISANGIDTLLHRVRRRLAEEGLMVPRRRVARTSPA